MAGTDGSTPSAAANIPSGQCPASTTTRTVSSHSRRTEPARDPQRSLTRTILIPIEQAKDRACRKDTDPTITTRTSGIKDEDEEEEGTVTTSSNSNTTSSVSAADDVDTDNEEAEKRSSSSAVISILGRRYDHHGVVFATTVLTGVALVSLVRRPPPQPPRTPTRRGVVEFQPQQQPQQEDSATPNTWQRRCVEGPPPPDLEVPVMEPVPDLDLVLVPVPERPDDEVHEPRNEHCVVVLGQHQLKHDEGIAVPVMTGTRAVVADILHSMVTTIIARTDNIDATILEEDKTPRDDDWLLVTVAKDEEPQDERGGRTEVKKDKTIWNVTVGATTSRITEVMATMMATTTRTRHGCYYTTYDEAEISDLILTDDSSSGSSNSGSEDGETTMELASTSREKQYAQLVFGTPAIDNEIRIDNVRANNTTTVEENGWIETIFTTTNAATASLPEVRILSYTYNDNSTSANCIIDDDNTATGLSEYTFCCLDVSILHAALSFCLSAPTTSSGSSSPTTSIAVHSGRYDPTTVAAKPTSSATSETTQPLPLALTEEELVSEVSHNILETARTMTSARPSSLSSSTWSSSVSSLVLHITRLSNQYKVTKWYHNEGPYDDRTEGATRHDRSEETKSATEHDDQGPVIIRDSIGRSVSRNRRSTSNIHPARETDQYYSTTITDHEPARPPQQGWMEMVYFLPAVDTDVVCF